MEYMDIKYEGGKRFCAQNRQHKVTIDQPEKFGRTEQGATPTELFIDSIGACVGVYVISYCKSVGLNTEGLTIKVEWEKELKEKPYHIKTINVKIDLPNADIGPRKAALLKVAESCLIHQTMKNQAHIDISLAS